MVNRIANTTAPLALQIPDEELVKRCRHGDRGAWRMLYDRHAPQVYRFLSALGVVADDREDALQEVFVAVFRSLDSFRGEAQLSTWIYRIASRHAGRLGRRRRVRDVLSTLLLREPPPPPGPDPAERAAEIHFVDRLLGRLSPKKRAVLVLFEIEGLPVDEIARIVDCPENTVWSRLHHARSEMVRLAKRGQGIGADRAADGNDQADGDKAEKGWGRRGKGGEA